MSKQVSIDQVEIIAPIDRNALLLGRMVCTTTFYTDGQWQKWLINEGRIHFMKIVDLLEGSYFGTAAAAPHDLHLTALNLIAQHACNEGTQQPYMGIWDDLYNIAACVAKLDLVAAHHDEIGNQAGRMVVTEVEYLAIQCRSIFDYVQKILKALWSQAHSKEDGSSQDKTLPDSFREVVMKDGKLRTAPDIRDKYKIPAPLAIIYAKHAPFFANLRTMRDAIVHKGVPTPTIFATEKGAYIEATLWPFRTMTTWRPDEFTPNKLVPLKTALGAMVFRTLLAAEELIHAYSLVVDLGPPICPKHVLFLRASSAPVLADFLTDAAQRYVPPTDAELFDTVLTRG